jgi:hypothetical protein
LDEGGEAARDIDAAIPYTPLKGVSLTVMTGWEPLRRCGRSLQSGGVRVGN